MKKNQSEESFQKQFWILWSQIAKKGKFTGQERDKCLELGEKLNLTGRQLEFLTQAATKLSEEKAKVGKVGIISHSKFMTLLFPYGISPLTGKARQPRRRLFSFVELFAFILPSTVRLSTFEPAYNDEKADFLRARRRYKSKVADVWLTFWFTVHVGLMVAQCFWGMCSDKVKKLFISHLPDLLRRLGGG